MEKTVDQYSASELLDILSFHVENGVDTCLDDDVANHFQSTQAAQSVAAPKNPLPQHYYDEHKPKQEAPQAVASVKPKPSIANDEAIAAAQMAAEAANSIEELKTAVTDFEHCALKRSAASTVFAQGDASAPIMILSEMPSRQDDETGALFCGEEGRLLDAMLSAISRSREECYMASFLPWRPAGGRQPNPVEAKICTYFTRKHVILSGAKLVIALGQGAASCLVNPSQNTDKKKSGIMQMRGNWNELDWADNKVAIASLTPSYLLQQSGHKRLAWADWQKIAAKLAELDI